jgi:hypothetical protein
VIADGALLTRERRIVDDRRLLAAPALPDGTPRPLKISDQTSFQFVAKQ